MNDNIAIKLDGVSKDFVLPHQKSNSVKSIFTGVFRERKGKSDKQHALRDISFEVKKGEFFGIVGRNGSGKSTLLKIIAEIYRPTKGSVTKSGRLVPFIELGVGFNPELTGRENVYLNGALLGFSTKEIDEQYDDIVQFAELEKFMDQKLKNYSSGMQVRLAFSVATRAKAEILLIDEVLAVGDADFQRKCFNYFKQLKGSNTTVIFVSHDMDAVREYCDRAVLVNESRLVDEGIPDDIAQQYTQLFIEDIQEEQQAGSESGRWGAGGLLANRVKVEVTDAQLSIHYELQSTRSVKSPVIGIRVRSRAGDYITGTNTKMEKYKTGTFNQDEERNIVWSMPNVLADGEYYIDSAIHESDGISVLDWWDEAVRFTVKKERQLPYNIDPGFTIK